VEVTAQLGNVQIGEAAFDGDSRVAPSLVTLAPPKFHVGLDFGLSSMSLLSA
jgi:hypothetical protein